MLDSSSKPCPLPSSDGSMKLTTKYFLPLPLLLILPLLLHLPRSELPDCPHAVVISQARHGSTWLLDSIEHCRYSRNEQVEPGIYGKRVYLDTELWHIHDSFLRNITIPKVRTYLQRNSVKLFPTAFNDVQRVEQLLTTTNTPVIVLRRNPKDACCSLEKALQSGEWANVKAQIPVEPGRCTCDENCQRSCRDWIRDTNNFFADVARLLHRSGVSADWLWYEHVNHLAAVTLRNAQCVVRNCNSANTEHLPQHPTP